MTSPTALASELRAARAVTGLSLSNVAAMAGITKSHLHDLEAGRAANPCVSTLVGLARALGDVSPLRLFAASAQDHGWSSEGAVEASPQSGLAETLRRTGHSCWRCKDGAERCPRGGFHRCEYPRADND